MNRVRNCFFRLAWMVLLFVSGQRVAAQCNPSVPDAIYSLSTDTLVCSGTSIQFISTSTGYKISHSWNFGDNTTLLDTSTNDTAGYTFHNTGAVIRQFSVRLRVTDSCGNHDSLIRRIHVTPDLLVNFSLSSTFGCDSVPFNFTDQSRGTGLSYSWNFDDPGSGSANTSTSASPSHRFDIGTTPDTFFVKLIVEDTCGNRDSLTRSVIVSPLPDAAFSFTDSLCSGAVAFSNQSTGTGINNTWNFGDASSGIANTSTQTSPSHLFDTTGSGYIFYPVSLKVQNTYGCRDSLVRNVFIRRGPDGTVDDFTSSTPFVQCSSNAAFFLTIDNSSTTTNNAYYLIDWGDTSLIDSLVSFSQDTNTYYGFGRYTLRVTVVDNVGCRRTDSVVVFNGSNPSGGIQSPGSTINLCAPINLGFPITGTGNNPPGTRYEFTVSDGSATVSYNHPPPDSFFHVFTEGSCGATVPGTPPYNNAFSVTLVITNPCGFTASSISPVTISGKPTAAIQPSHDTACISSDLVNIRDVSAGAGYVIQSGANFNCDTVPLRRWRIDRAASTYTLVSGFLGGATFNNNANPGVNGNGSNALDIRFFDTGYYTISLLSGYPGTNTQRCGYDSTAIRIYIVDTVSAAFDLPLDPSTGCINNAVAVNNLSTGPIQEYRWTVTPNSGYTLTTGSLGSRNPEFRFNTPGVYVIRLEVENECNEDDTSATIIIRGRPIVTLPADIEYCGTQALAFSSNSHRPSTDTSYSSISSYRWRISGGAFGFSGGTDSTSLHPQVQFQDTGWYQVLFTATNVCGESVADTQRIHIKPIPQINTQSDISVCPEATVAPSAFVSAPSGASFTWTNSNTLTGLAASGSGSISSFTAAANTSGTNRTGNIVVNAVLNGCNASPIDFDIEVKARPVSGSISDIIICPGDTVRIPAFSSNPGGSAFAWTNTNTGIGLGASGNGNIPDFAAPPNLGTSPINGTIVFVPTLNGCVGAADSFDVSIRTRPVMTGLQDTLICPNALFQYPAFQSVPSGASFLWENNTTSIGLTDTGSGNLPSFTAFNNTTGSIVYAQVRVVPTYAVCLGIADTFLIGVKPAPVLVPSNDTIVCPGDSIFTQAFAASPAGSTFSWTNSNTSTGLGASGTGNVAAFRAAANLSGSARTSQVRVIATLNSCPGAADTFLITVKPTPVPQAINDILVCPAGMVQVPAFASAPAGASFTWTNTNTAIGLAGSGSGNISDYQAPANGSGVTQSAWIVYIPTLQSCPGAADSFTIGIKPTPVMTASSDIEVCTWDSIRPAAFVSIPSGSSFSWTNSSANIGLAASGNGSIAGYIAPANTSGTLQSGQVRVVPVLNSCVGPADSFVIGIRPQPIADAGPADTLCNGQSTQIGQSAVAGESYSWSSVPAGFSGTNAGVQVSPATTTLYRLTVYDSSTQCIQRDSVRIVVNPVLSANTISADQVICAGQTPATLSGSNPGGGNSQYAFQWQQSTDSTNWTSIGGAVSAGFSPGSLFANTHYRRVVVSGPCSDTSSAVRIIVLPALGNNSIGIADSICAFFAPDTLRGTSPTGGNGNYGFSWQFSTDTTQVPTAIVGASGRDHYPGVLTTTTFFRRVVNSGACTVPGNWVEIRVKPKPVAAFTATNSCFAYGNSFNSTSSVSTGNLALHEWDFGDTAFSTSTVPTHTYSFAGAKTVKLIVTSDFGCKDSLVRTVHVHPKPLASFDSTNACHDLANAFANTSTLSVGNIVNNAWSFGDGQFSSAVSPSHVYADTGTYPVRLIVTSDSGCTDSAFRTVEVYPKPVAAFSDEDVCFGQTTHFMDNSSVGAGSLVNWHWNFGDGDTSNVRHATQPYSTADTFTVTLYVRTDRGCLDTIGQDVIVYPSIAGNSISQDDTICSGSQTNGFSGSSPSGGTGTYQYQWESSPDTSTWTAVSGGTGQNLAAQTLTTSTWFRRVVTSSPCDTNERSISNKIFILVTPGIDNNFISAHDSICAFFASDTLKGNTPVGGTGNYVYQWEQASDSTQAGAVINGANAIDYYPGVLTTTVFYRRVVSSGSCDTRSNWVEIRVKPKPVAAFTATNSCFAYGNSFNSTSSVSTGNLALHEWDFGDTAFSTSTVPTHTYSFAGAKTVKLIVTSDFGCKDSLVRTVHVHPKPLASFDSTNACHDLANAFANTSTLSVGNIVNNAWRFGDGQFSSAVSPSHVYADTGTYPVRLIVTSDSGCTDSAFRTVEVYPKPVAAFSDEDVCFGQTTHFMDNSSVGAGSLVNWHWNFGDGDTSNVRHATQPYSTADTFTVTLYVRTDRGCLDTVGQDVIVYPSLANNSISQDDTICSGSQTNGFSGSSPSGGTGTYQYQWESSPDTSTWTAVSGGTGQNLAAQTLTTSTWFRRVVTSSPCDTNERSISNKIFILVTPGITNNTVTSDQVICYAQAPDTLRGSVPSGGSGSYSFQWQQSTDNTSWTNINGATGQNYRHGGMTDTLHFRRFVLSQACDLVSNPVKIAVKPLPEPGFTSQDICFPEPSAFADTSVVNQGSIVSRRFYFGDGDSSQQASVSHFYSAAGTYTVKLKITTDFGCVDSVSRGYSVYDKPDARIDQDNICFPFAMGFADSSLLASGSLSAWKWYFGDGDSSVVQHPSHTYTADGSYGTTLIVTTGFGCMDTANRTVRVFPKPGPSWGSTEVCFPNATNFSDSTTLNSGSLQTWNWNFGDGNGSAQQNPVHSYTTAGTYTVKLIVVSDSNCVDSLSKTVEVRPLPVVGFTLDTLGCLNANNALTNTTTGSVSQVWTFGNGQSATGFHETVSYTSIGSYPIRLVATTQYGCVDSADRPIRIIAPPIAAISLDLDSGCAPLSVSFANHSVNEFPTYQWDLGNGTTYSDTLPPDEVYLPSLFTDTTYFITLTAGNKCGTDIAVDSVRVLPVPTAALGLAVSQGCSPLHLQLFNGSYGRPHYYTWLYGDGDTANHGNGSHYHTFITGTLDTTYTITLIARNDCGVDTARDQILVKPNTVTSFFNTDTTRGCAPLSVRFTDLSVGGNYLYYDFGDGNNSFQANPVHTFAGPGTYTILQFVDNGCSYDTSSIQVEVLPGVTPAFTINKKTECLGTDLVFTNHTIGSGAVRWYFGDGDSSDNNTVNHDYQQSGKFYVTLRAISSANGCPSQRRDSVQIQPLPGSRFVLPLNNGCPPFVLNTQNQTGNGQFYTWIFGDGNTASGLQPSHTYTQTGNYSVKLISVSADGCVDSTQAPVIVHPVPTAAFSFAFDTECDTPSLINLTNISQGATAFQWTFGDGGNSIQNNPVHAYYQFGTFTIRLFGENSFGCWDTTSSFHTVYPVPLAAFTLTPDSGCMPLEVQFTNGSQNTSTYHWDLGDGNTSVQEDPLHTYLSDGMYDVRLIAIGGGSCDDTLAIDEAVLVFPKPVAAFTYIQVDNDPVAKGLVRFTNTSTDADLYQWDFGDGTESSVLNPEHRYAFHGSYIVQLAVSNSYGCLDTALEEIPLTFFKGLFVPNAFTPEYGIPEVRVFKPSGTSLKTYHLRIFDTWGNLLWESNLLQNGQPVEGWDGRLDNKLLEQDVYVWKIHAEFLDGTVWPGMQGKDGKFRKEGTVTLIR